MDGGSAEELLAFITIMNSSVKRIMKVKKQPQEKASVRRQSFQKSRKKSSSSVQNSSKYKTFGGDVLISNVHIINSARESGGMYYNNKPAYPKSVPLNSCSPNLQYKGRVAGVQQTAIPAQMHPYRFKDCLLETTTEQNSSYGDDLANFAISSVQAQDAKDVANFEDLKYYLYQASVNKQNMCQTLQANDMNDCLFPGSESVNLVNHLPSDLKEKDYQMSVQSGQEFDGSQAATLNQWYTTQLTYADPYYDQESNESAFSGQKNDLYQHDFALPGPSYLPMNSCHSNLFERDVFQPDASPSSVEESFCSSSPQCSIIDDFY